MKIEVRTPQGLPALGIGRQGHYIDLAGDQSVFDQLPCSVQGHAKLGGFADYAQALFAVSQVKNNYSVQITGGGILSHFGLLPAATVAGKSKMPEVVHSWKPAAPSSRGGNLRQVIRQVYDMPIKESITLLLSIDRLVERTKDGAEPKDYNYHDELEKKCLKK